MGSASADSGRATAAVMSGASYWTESTPGSPSAATAARASGATPEKTEPVRSFGPDPGTALSTGAEVGFAAGRVSACTPIKPVSGRPLVAANAPTPGLIAARSAAEPSTETPRKRSRDSAETAAVERISSERSW